MWLDTGPLLADKHVLAARAGRTQTLALALALALALDGSRAGGRQSAQQRGRAGADKWQSAWHASADSTSPDGSSGLNERGESCWNHTPQARQATFGRGAERSGRPSPITTRPPCSPRFSIVATGQALPPRARETRFRNRGGARRCARVCRLYVSVPACALHLRARTLRAACLRAACLLAACLLAGADWTAGCHAAMLDKPPWRPSQTPPTSAPRSVSASHDRSRAVTR